jgi:ketose-bisphosphate aldolase
MKNLEYYFQKAKKEKWAIGQFNFSTMGQFRGILDAAQKLKSPIIVGTSEGESDFLDLGYAVRMIRFWREKMNIPVFLNLDHGKSFEYVKEAIDRGYDTVQFDGSELTLEENIKITKKVVDYAHKKEILVEGELGVIGEAGDNKGKKEKERNFTNLDDIDEFIKKTNVDRLAVSIGNVHGVSKEAPTLDLDRLKEIKKRAEIYLVLHGGSGISDEDIKKAIAIDISKINVNTEIRIAWRESLERVLKDNPGEVKSYNILPQVSEAVQRVVEEKIKLFGSANRL